MRISGFAPCALMSCVAVAMLSGCGGSQPLSPALSASNKATAGRETFHYTGSEQRFVVPRGVEEITVKATGAAGRGSEIGTNSSGGAQFPGYGGRVLAVVDATPGETLSVFAGGQPSRYSQSGGFNGGGDGGSDRGYCHSNGFGGGGATDVRKGGDALADRIVVAGGGGGAGNSCVYGSGFGGRGGGLTGGTGGGSGSYSSFGGGGSGGSQQGGGKGGSGGHGGRRHDSGKRGRLGIGGAGGKGGATTSSASGGGGGGYYGGGGGGGAAAVGSYGGGGGGGGGSSYVEPSASKVHMWQNWKKATGNGLVVLSW